MVGRLLSSRRLWGVVAAVLVAATALVTWQARRSGPAHADNGRVGSLLATVDWNEPVLLLDGRSVMVYADVMHLPNYCLGQGLPTLRPSVTETAGSVTIKVRAYRNQPPPPPTVLCAAVGHAPVPVTAELSQPLGRRNLLTAAGTVIPVLDAAKVPAPAYLPPGYQPTAFGGAPTTGSYRYFEQLPRPGDGTQIDLRINQRLPPIDTLYEQQLVARGVVLGHPAEVVQSGGTIAVQRCAIWTERPYVWSICSYSGDERLELSAAELLRIGNSLRLP